MLSLVPGDRLWNRYRVESVAPGGAWLEPLHEPPAGTESAARVLLLALEKRPQLAPLAELLRLAGTAVRLREPRALARATGLWGGTRRRRTGGTARVAVAIARQRAAPGVAGHADAFQELPLLGRVAWVGDPARDGVALIAVPPTRTLTEFSSDAGPLPAAAALPLLTGFAGALAALLQSAAPDSGLCPRILFRLVARLLHPGAVALRTDTAQLTLRFDLPEPAAAFQPLPWADFLAPELYRADDVSPAACVFGVARTGAFLLSPDEAARARRTSGTNMGLKAATAEARRAPSSSEPEAAWAALAEWASGKRDAAREFASSPAAASVPEELRGLLARCLAKTPARRPATPGRLHAALNALAACPWSRAGTLCEGCGFVLAEDHVAATCPCCGRRRAPPEGLSDRLAEAPHRWERHGPPATGGAATQVAVQTENMTLVPAGVFVSGENKAPRTLRAFAVDTRPVTEGDYKRFLAAAGRAPRANGAGSRGPEFDSHPVTRVTWYEANEYAEFHGERLPTVYEWEKAARGTDGRRFPFGNTFKPGTGRLLKSTADGARKRARAPVGTAPVGSQPGGASPYGVLDMAGNVLQWTSTARRAGERLFRAVKGSCYLDGSPELARCTSVQYLPPEASEPYLGFRCVKDVE